jgi:hypothetical protein
MDNTVVLRTAPAVGRFRLYSDQTRSCTFFDAHDIFAAKSWAIGSIGMMVSDKSGTLTDLSSGVSWEISVELREVSA